jgi:hypothetical protein
MAEMTIRRFGVLSVAKMNGILWLVFGLIIGVLYGLFFIIFGAAMSSFAPEGQGIGATESVVVGIVFMIAIPATYGVMGLIAGAIGALVYNILAGIIGGIKFEIEGVQQAYAPPPPPQGWAPNQYPAQ